eukprot:5433138-Pyramimonas_sp.AAC.1
MILRSVLYDVLYVAYDTTRSYWPTLPLINPDEFRHIPFHPTESAETLDPVGSNPEQATPFRLG